MKLFGGFSGNRTAGGRSAQRADAEPKKKSAAKPTAAQELEAEHIRTPEEAAELDEIIAAWQKKKKRRLFIVLGILLALVIGGWIAWKSIVKPPDIVQPTSKPTPTPAQSAEPQPSKDPGTKDPDVTPSVDPEVTPTPIRSRRDNVYTFLLVGREQSYGNTDTLMVGVYDADTPSLNIISIPRDTCANVESDTSLNELKKINSVYARAGIEGLRTAVEDICGFPIDSYISVGINGFIHLVDTIGGITFDIPYDMDYDDPTQDLYIHFRKGTTYLTGSDAIKVVRWRQNNDGTNYGDVARITNQQNFLKAVIRQCLSWKNLSSNLDTYLSIFRDYVKTDMSNGNMTWYATQVLKLSMDDIHFYTLPSNYTDSIRGFAYGLIHVDEWVDLLNEAFNVYDAPMTVDDIDVITRDANGNLIATSGEIKGGMDSFLDYNVYLVRLREWLATQQKTSNEAPSGQGNVTGSNETQNNENPTLPDPGTEEDNNGGE